MEYTIDGWNTSMKYHLTNLVSGEIKNFIATLAIALSLGAIYTAIDIGAGYPANTVICLSIGISMYLAIVSVFYLFRPLGQWVRILLAIAALTGGALVGLLAGCITVMDNFWHYLHLHMGIFIEVIILSTITGFLFWYIVDSQRKMSHAIANIQKEKIKRLTIEKQVVESNLRVLQAQIEPHFLFNTLSNIITLLDLDTAKGKNMLENLTAYLRVTLSKTREEKTTLGNEVEMIESYLNIFKDRMGDRLNFGITISDELKRISFPPMLLQPIVENAVLHGLEPKIEGGGVWIRAEKLAQYIRIEVSDSGLGVSQDNYDWGIGLSNIQSRLEVLYEGQARMYFEKNHPTGLIVSIEIPL